MRANRIDDAVGQNETHVDHGRQRLSVTQKLAVFQFVEALDYSHTAMLGRDIGKAGGFIEIRSHCVTVVVSRVLERSPILARIVRTPPRH